LASPAGLGSIHGLSSASIFRGFASTRLVRNIRRTEDIESKLIFGAFKVMTGRYTYLFKIVQTQRRSDR
jgi:hypothetical protein